MDVMTEARPPVIRLVISDVDGTLLNQEKALTERACQAVEHLHEAGIAFAITSARPPRGLRMLVEPLRLTTPLGAFNGGCFANPDLSIIDEQFLPADLVAPIIGLIESCGLDIWVYRGQEWLVRDRHGPHVDREEATVAFAPTVVSGYHDKLDGVLRIVGVSDDLDGVARCEADARRQFGAGVSAARSQPYYLDVTHPQANKGTVVRRLSEMLGIPTHQIATIGDSHNDVAMFAASGLSIAMGNASPEVQRAARFVTASNQQDGFARAVEEYILEPLREPVASRSAMGHSAVAG